MFERFTENARKVMALANTEAQRFGHGQIGTEHIFLGLIRADSGAGVTILRDCGVDTGAMVNEIDQLIRQKIKSQPQVEIERKQTQHSIKVIEYAIEEAIAMDHDYIGTEHILLGLLRENEGIAAMVLANLGVTIDDVRSRVQ